MKPNRPTPLVLEPRQTPLAEEKEAEKVTREVKTPKKIQKK